MAKKQLALLIDLDRCIGCHACTIACEVEHSDPPGVRRIKVATVGGQHQETPAGVWPNVWMYFQPRMCQHCDNPPCMAACPYDAIEKREDGIVLVVPDNCPGCELCLPACPYDVMVMKPGEQIVAMCDLCYHRLDVGLNPFCADACPGYAIFYGDINDPGSEVNKHKRSIRKNRFLLSGGEKNSHRPSVEYVSLKQKREKDATIIAAT